MNKNTAIILGTSIVGVSLLGWYSKKTYDLVTETIGYDYDKESVRVIKLGLNDTRINMNLIIDNKGEFAADVKDISINITSNGILLTKVQRRTEFRILPKTVVPFDVTLQLNPKELIKNSKGLNLLNYQDMPITFKGSLKVKKMGIWIKIPISFTYMLREFL